MQSTAEAASTLPSVRSNACMCHGGSKVSCVSGLGPTLAWGRRSFRCVFAAYMSQVFWTEVEEQKRVCLGFGGRVQGLPRAAFNRAKQQ